MRINRIEISPRTIVTGLVLGAGVLWALATMPKADAGSQFGGFCEGLNPDNINKCITGIGYSGVIDPVTERAIVDALISVEDINRSGPEGSMSQVNNIVCDALPLSEGPNGVTEVDFANLNIGENHLQVELPGDVKVGDEVECAFYPKNTPNAGRDFVRRLIITPVGKKNSVFLPHVPVDANSSDVGDPVQP